jgi:glutamate 5-kinase
MEKLGRLVVKVGTAVLTGDGADLDVARMGDLARQLAALAGGGTQVLLVSSGAIAAGRARLALRRTRGDIPSKQMLAAVGQHLLMQTWDGLLRPHGLTVAQTLLTRADLRDRQGYLNARTTLIGLVEHGVLPVINENDVVRVDEIHIRGVRGAAGEGPPPDGTPQDERLFGDNDNLAAMVANLVDAHLLVNLTNTGGLYTGDPRHDPEARLIPEVARINACIEALAGEAGTAQGTGGMRTKIEAAKLATASGIAVVIAPGAERDVLLRLAAGESIGTRFRPAVSRREARKRWILSALASRAALHVDAGAADAVRHRGRSLLAAGVRQVSGRFRRGDPVGILDLQGERIACGLVSYDADEVRRIAGLHSQGIADVLGHTFGDEVIHRNNLVLLNAAEG